MLNLLFALKNSKCGNKSVLWLIVLPALLMFLSCSRMSPEEAKKNDDPNTATVTLNQPAKKANVLRMTDMEFTQLMQVSSQLLDEFWKKSFPEMGWQRPYVSPRALIPYFQPTQTGCGLLSMQNAFYCSADHSIYYDDVFVRALYKDPGDYSAVTVLAHEWGHSVQKDLGILGGDKTYYTIQTELQADCFAGAFAKYIFEKGYLEEGDLEEGGAALLSVGDSRNTKWFDPQAHGKPFQRGAYFNKGWEGGLTPCMGK